MKQFTTYIDEAGNTGDNLIAFRPCSGKVQEIRSRVGRKITQPSDISLQTSLILS